MTTAEATVRGIPRWMALAMPDDVAQCAALVDIEFRTPTQRAEALRYYLRELRRTQWERRPSRPARRPKSLRPSKLTSGYRTDSAKHAEARQWVSLERRREIARMGAAAATGAEKEGSMNDTVPLTRRATIQALIGAPAAHGEPPVKRCWLDAYSSAEIIQAAEDAGIYKPLRSALRRIGRQAVAARRRESRTENVVLFRGSVTDPLPFATWREVKRGTKSRTAKADIRIADLGAPAIFQGVALPRGTRLLVDSKVSVGGDGALPIDAVGEVIQTPTGMRVHIWRGSSPRAEVTAQPRRRSPLPPPLMPPTHDAHVNPVDPAYAEQIMREALMLDDGIPLSA